MARTDRTARQHAGQTRDRPHIRVMLGMQSHSESLSESLARTGRDLVERAARGRPDWDRPTPAAEQLAAAVRDAAARLKAARADLEVVLGLHPDPAREVREPQPPLPPPPPASPGVGRQDARAACSLVFFRAFFSLAPLGSRLGAEPGAGRGWAVAGGGWGCVDGRRCDRAARPSVSVSMGVGDRAGAERRRRAPDGLLIFFSPAKSNFLFSKPYLYSPVLGLGFRVYGLRSRDKGVGLELREFFFWGGGEGGPGGGLEKSGKTLEKKNSMEPDGPTCQSGCYMIQSRRLHSSAPSVSRFQVRFCNNFTSFQEF